MRPSKELCRFVNDELHIWERKKDSFRRLPVEWSHREIVVLSLADGQLLYEAIERIKLMRCIKLFVILSMTAFHLAVMSGRERPNLLVLYSQLSQCLLKECLCLSFAIAHLVGELKSIIRLDAHYGIWEMFNHMYRKTVEAYVLCSLNASIAIPRISSTRRKNETSRCNQME